MTPIAANAGRHPKHPKVASTTSPANGGGDKFERTPIMTTTGEHLELACVLHTADLELLTPESLRSTARLLKAQTAKLSSGRPTPALLKTLDGYEFACFDDEADCEAYCKFDVLENLELLLERGDAEAASSSSKTPGAPRNRASTGDNHHLNEQQQSSADGDQHHQSNDTTSSTTAAADDPMTAVRRNRRKQNQAAVPYSEQFTYSMEFLDDEHFGERYPNEEEELLDEVDEGFHYDDEEANIPQHDPSGRGNNRGGKQLAKRTSPAQVDGSINRNNQKRPLQQQNNNSSSDRSGSVESQNIHTAKRARLNNVGGRGKAKQQQQQPSEDEQQKQLQGNEGKTAVNGLEKPAEKKVKGRRLALKAKFGSAPPPVPLKATPAAAAHLKTAAGAGAAVLAKGRTPSLQAPQSAPAAPPPPPPPPAEEESMDDIMVFEGPVPSIFNGVRDDADFESIFEQYLRYQDKVYRSVMNLRRRHAEAAKRRRTHSLVTKPGRNALPALQKLLFPGYTGARNTTSVVRPTEQQRMQVPSQHNVYQRQQQNAARRILETAQSSSSQGAPLQMKRILGRRTHKLQQLQPQQLQQQMMQRTNGRAVVRQIVMGSGATVQQQGQQQGQQIRTMAQHHNVLARNSQLRIRLPGPGTAGTANATTLIAPNAAASPRVFNSGTMRVQLAQPGQGQRTFLRTQPSTTSTAITYIQNPRTGQLVPLASTATNFATTQQLQPRQQQLNLNQSNQRVNTIVGVRQQQQPLRTYTAVAASSQGQTAIAASASPSIYVINTAPGSGAGSLTLKPHGTASNTVLLNARPGFVNIAPRPTTTATIGGGGGGAPTVNNNASGKITIQMVRGTGGVSTSGGTTTTALLNGQSVRVLSVPAGATTAAVPGGGGGGQKTMVALRQPLTSSGVGGSIAATTATVVSAGGGGGTPVSLGGGGALDDPNRLVAVPIATALAIARRNATPMGAQLVKTITELQSQAAQQHQLRQQQQQPVRTFAIRAPTPTLVAAPGRTAPMVSATTATTALPISTANATFVSRRIISNSSSSSDSPGTFRVPLVPGARQTISTSSPRSAAAAAGGSPSLVVVNNRSSIISTQGTQQQQQVRVATPNNLNQQQQQQLLNSEKMRRMLAEQQLHNPSARFVLRSTTPVLHDGGRTVSVQTAMTNTSAGPNHNSARHGQEVEEVIDLTDDVEEEVAEKAVAPAEEAAAAASTEATEKAINTTTTTAVDPVESN